MNLNRRIFLKTTAASGIATLGGTMALADKRPISKDIADASRNSHFTLQFRGTTAEDCHAWQTAFRSLLESLLGETRPPEKWTVEEDSKTEFDDHTRLELLLHAEGLSSVPVYLLIPKGASKSKPAPAVLCVHGHGDYGNHPIVGRTDIDGVAKSIKGAHYDYGLQFVRRGYVVAAPCMIPFGRRVDRDKYGKTDPCATTFVRLQALGKLTISENLRDLRWCLDLLQKRPEVQDDRLGCAGLSYGGRMTMMVTAIDQRIQVAAVSGALNLLQERIFGRYSCGSQIVPGLLRYGDYSEIGSLIAPRPCVWEVGAKDGLIKPNWAAVFRQRLERAYKAYGKPDALQFDYYDGGHRWNGEVAYPLFDRVLKA